MNQHDTSAVIEEARRVGLTTTRLSDAILAVLLLAERHGMRDMSRADLSRILEGATGKRVPTQTLYYPTLTLAEDCLTLVRSKPGVRYALTREGRSRAEEMLAASGSP